MEGIPIGSEVERGANTRVFDHVPALHELQKREGWPGITYAQVCVHNLMRAKERAQAPAHLTLIGGTSYYTVVGPKGQVSMALVGCGKQIPGAAPEAGARLFFTDGEVEELTGHPVVFPIWLRPQEVAGSAEEPFAPRADRAGEGAQGHAGVPEGLPPQRKQQRPGGQVAGSGGRDRDERSGPEPAQAEGVK